MRFRGVSSVGGVFVVLALAISLLTLTHLTLRLNESVSEVLKRISYEKEAMNERVEFKKLNSQVLARVVGNSKFVYVVSWPSNSNPKVYKVEDPRSWFNLESYTGSHKVYIVTESGRVFDFANSSSTNNIKTVALSEGAVGVEGYEYKSLGYLSLNAWRLNLKFKAVEGGISRTLISKLEITEKKHPIYPDAICEVRDYVYVYFPIFSYASSVEINLKIYYEYSLSISATVKSRDVRLYSPHYSWRIYFDVGKLPLRRIVYHNGYYWTSYASPEERVLLEDVISGFKVKTYTWTYTILSKSGYVEFYENNAYSDSSFKSGNLEANMRVDLDSPTYLTILRLKIPVRTILYQDLINAYSQLSYYYTLKVISIDYEIS